MYSTQGQGRGGKRGVRRQWPRLDEDSWRQWLPSLGESRASLLPGPLCVTTVWLAHDSTKGEGNRRRRRAAEEVEWGEEAHLQGRGGFRGRQAEGGVRRERSPVAHQSLWRQGDIDLWMC